MKDYQKIIQSYIRSQAITYFGFVILFLGALALEKGKPVFSRDWMPGIIPTPYFYLPVSITWGFIIFCFGVSLFLAITLFRISWQNQALRLIEKLSVPFLMATLITLFLAWISGVGHLTKITTNPRLHDAFTIAYIFLFLALTIDIIRNLNRGNSQPIKTNMKKTARPVLALLNYFKLKPCVDCAYLAQSKTSRLMMDDNERLSLEPTIYSRGEWRKGKKIDIGEAYCFRREWDNSRIDDSHGIANLSTPKYCSKFFPYSGGTPSEHMESHRSRTNRRWLVTGAFIGPYIATTVGFIGAKLDSGGINGNTIFLAIVGLLVLASLSSVINITFNNK